MYITCVFRCIPTTVLVLPVPGGPCRSSGTTALTSTSSLQRLSSKDTAAHRTMTDSYDGLRCLHNAFHCNNGIEEGCSSGVLVAVEVSPSPLVVPLPVRLSSVVVKGRR